MERLPDPPSVEDLLRGAPPETRTFDGGSLFWRIFFGGGDHPVAWNAFRHYGPTDSRFDHHPAAPPARNHQHHAILYAAERPAAAFGEFFQRTATINRTFNRPFIVQFSIREPLTLLDLTRGWIVKVGGGAAIASGDREQARQWSRVFHDAFPALDGICYRSSLNPDWILVALYERALHCMPLKPLLRASLKAANVQDLVTSAMRDCNYNLL